MRFRGGYNVLLEGRPGVSVKTAVEPRVLYLPLRSSRFEFGRICVEDGQRIEAGTVLAHDDDNYGVPLVAPRAGTVRLNAAAGHIVLEDIAKGEGAIGDEGDGRNKLLRGGAWQYFYDAYTGAVPDPFGEVQCAIVSTVCLDSFVARGGVQIQDALDEFVRGLEALGALVGGQRVYLILPDARSRLCTRISERVNGYEWLRIVKIKLKYPYDNFNILARGLGLKKGDGPIWSMRAEGVLATDRVLTGYKACTERIISVGGSGVKKAAHVRLTTGYPIEAIRNEYVGGGDVKIISGGMFAGQAVGEGTLGIDAECQGLTVLLNPLEREFLSFVRGGWDRSSYSGCFLSWFRKPFDEQYTTGVRGEGRPCISCNYCDEVCPAGIMPHLIHKYLYRDMVEAVDGARVDLCVRCGLCSFVCPSKIELRKEFIEAHDLLEHEKDQARKAEAARQAAGNSDEGPVEENN